ncbi:hypothetical protein [Occallatibacter savannae]|uniref:hypothetical protein n=1 Tax=Occallatibacter savannae TaxID=1002691 RepID=UPI0013A58DA5|nr:hypothetical protein [Occallatibacter savannae]
MLPTGRVLLAHRAVRCVRWMIEMIHTKAEGGRLTRWTRTNLLRPFTTSLEVVGLIRLPKNGAQLGMVFQYAPIYIGVQVEAAG